VKKIRAAAALAASALAGGVALAGDGTDLPPWSDALPGWARSAHVLEPEEPIFTAPDRNAPRRGAAEREARLPLFGAQVAPGCRAGWLHVGPQAWLCGDAAEVSGQLPLDAGPRLPANDTGLPFRYFFAGPDGSLAYDRLDEVDVGEPQMTLEPGFAVAIVEEARVGGELYGRTNRGKWVPLRDLGPARLFDFQGADIADAPDGVIPVAWVVSDFAAVYARAGGSFQPTGEQRHRFDRVAWLEEAGSFGGRYARIDDRRWIRASDVRHPTIAPPPDEVAAGERWIDVELDTQTLTAWEGDRPVFATIVSTGKGKTKGHPFETPRGVYPIWIKLLTATMDNLEDEGAARYWRIEDVPWVQFIHKGVALHAAFWHRSFGQVRSHGCINLAPLDAQRLFAWTGPRLPAGWTAVLPGTYDKATVVRVR
jgi:L,D-transpeptidase-like protein